MATVKEVAEWMVAKLNESSPMYQNKIVLEIQELFGDEFVYNNFYGNLAISKEVLEEFRKLTPNDVVWSKSEQFWRKRRPDDPPGRSIWRK